MEQKNTRLRNVGFITFFFSGICAISSGVVVSLLQEQYGFAYGMTGTLLSLMSIGNLLAGFLIAMLPGKLGMKPSILLLTIGYALGYAMMGLCGALLDALGRLVEPGRNKVSQRTALGFGQRLKSGREVEQQTRIGGRLESGSRGPAIVRAAPAGVAEQQLYFRLIFCPVGKGRTQ